MLAKDETLAVSGGEDGSVRVWDLATEREQAILTGHAGEVFSVALTPDGTRAVSGGDDGTVRVWNLTADRGSPPPQAGFSRQRSPETAPERSAAAATGCCGSGTWPPGARRPPSPATPAPSSVWRSPQTAPWRSAAGGLTGPFGSGTWLPEASGPSSPATPAGVGGGHHPGRRPGGQRQRRRHPAGLGPGHRPPGGSPSPASAGEVFSVALTPDGTCAISGGRYRTVRVWDLATGSDRAVLAGHTRAGVGGGHHPDTPGGQRRRRRHPAGLGPGHRPPGGCPHRPCRRGLLRGAHPGRHLRRQRKRRRVRADLGSDHRGRDGTVDGGSSSDRVRRAIRPFPHDRRRAGTGPPVCP